MKKLEPRRTQCAFSSARRSIRSRTAAPRNGADAGLVGQRHLGLSPHQNSIETCLVNVDNCDVAIVLLSQRYGPSLQPAGYPDISATHLEYRRAVEHNNPTHVYVRDRLLAEWGVWSKNKDKASSFAWVKKSDERLFELLEEHAKLTSDGRKNWMDPFRDSFHLKQLIARDFRIPASKRELERLIRSNQIPILNLTVDLAPLTDNMGETRRKIRLAIQNQGTIPAYNVRLLIEARDKIDSDWATIPIIAAGTERQLHLLADCSLTASFETIASLQYQFPQGHHVMDTFRVGIYERGSHVLSGASFLKREYRVARLDERAFVIKDD